MTRRATATFTPSISASATVAARPLRAASQCRSLAIASNAALQHQRPNGSVFSISDAPAALRRPTPQTIPRAWLQRLGHTVEP
jgi:hypothetical protein